jgi:hypothetical protein
MLLGFTVFQSPCTSHYEFWQEVPLTGAETNNQHTKNMGKNSKNIVTKSMLLSTTAPQFLMQRCQTNTAFVANHFQHCDYDTIA